MDEDVSSELKAILSRPERDELLSNPRRLAELVRERLGPEHKREASFLNIAMQEGVPKRLLALSATSLTDHAIETYARFLSDSTGLQEDIARWSIAAWAHGLGLTITGATAEQEHSADVPRQIEAGHFREELEPRRRENGKQPQAPLPFSGVWRQNPILVAVVVISVIGLGAIGMWSLTPPPVPPTPAVDPSPSQPAPTPPGSTPTPTKPVARPQIAVTPLESAREQALQPGDKFQECTKCPQMIVVPSGKFDMGSLASEPGHQSDESPKHTVTIGQPFAVAQFDVTFDEWDTCVADGGCGGKSPSDQGWGRGRRPVINVSWADAKAFVAWLSKLTGKNYRLLTEAEYEHAARADTTTTYPWGNALGKNNASCVGCGSQWDDRQTAPVGSFAPNGFGLFDMVGNVWQWTEDRYHPTYNNAPTDGSAWTEGNSQDHVVRGGSWNATPDCIRAANRHQCTPVNPGGTLGFRVARTLVL